MKDIYALIDYYGTKKSCEMSQMILKIKGSGARAATLMLYKRLVLFASNTANEQRWIVKPLSIKKITDVEDWLKDTSKIGISSSDLLNFFKPSTFRDSLVFLVKEGFVTIDRFNRMHVKYPFDGKMLSLKYAEVAIKSSLKKPVTKEDEKPSLDKQDESGVVSSPSEGLIGSEPVGIDFWNN